MNKLRLLSPPKFAVLWIITIHLVLVLVAFIGFRMHPGNVIFNHEGDGLKNLFTLQTYVTDSVDSRGFYHTRAFNYPWGEYEVTTDNTPAIAIPMKWWHQHIAPLGYTVIPLFNMFTMLSIILAGVLCYALFKRLFTNKWIAFIAAIILPWTNMQVARIWRGHFNLSYSFLLLFAFLLLTLWIQSSSSKKRNWYGFGMIGLLFVAFLFHGYYLPIIGLIISSTLFFYSLYQVKNRQWLHPLVSAVLITIGGLLLSLLFLNLTDGFLAERSKVSSGYDWMELKVRFWGLFTSPDFYSWPSPVKNMRTAMDPETMGYLGHVCTYGFILLIVASIISKKQRREIFDIQKQFFANPIMGSLFFMGLLMLFVSWGDIYYTNDDKGLAIQNMLNPLYWAHKITNYVEQFRALGRFTWPLFWTINIWMIYTLYHWLQRNSPQVQKLILFAALALSASEVKSYVDTMQNKAKKENYLSAAHIKHLSLPAIDYSKFQAALFLPFYHVGTEIGPLIIDDKEEVSVFSYQFYLKTRLPLINTKLSRTSQSQSQMTKDWIHNITPDAALIKQLNSKPILVVRHHASANDSALFQTIRPEIKDYYFDALTLPERAPMQLLDSANGYSYYQWNQH